ncbi:tetraspanin-9-like [Mya arenaria]|uniref:tetraspanin-9-like n=1 Tax=Mya arenaria TaxID=6604 RepID=UPI0022E7E636|nr:tetraspanin-9-like [Mya arenaria]
MASSKYRTTQILFVICNLLFLVMGVAMLVVGAYWQISRSNYIDLMPSDEFFTVTALLIASGTIVIVVCLFGFIGVWMQSQCVILIYMLCVLVILALSIAAGVIAYVFHSEIDSELEKKLLEGLRDSEKRDEWDKLQQAERCCGVKNSTDWYGQIDPDYPETLPDSCCDGPNCGSQGRTVAYDVGCYQKGKNWVEDNFYALGAAGITLGVLQIVTVLVSCLLIMMMRREKTLMV